MSEDPGDVFQQYLEMMDSEPNTQAMNFRVRRSGSTDRITVFLLRDKAAIEALTRALDGIVEDDPTGRRSDVVRKKP